MIEEDKREFELIDGMTNEIDEGSTRTLVQ